MYKRGIAIFMIMMVMWQTFAMVSLADEQRESISAGNPGAFGELEVPEVIAVKWINPNTHAVKTGLLNTCLYRDQVYVNLNHEEDLHVGMVWLCQDNETLNVEIRFTDTKAVFSKEIDFSDAMLVVEFAEELADLSEETFVTFQSRALTRINEPEEVSLLDSTLKRMESSIDTPLADLRKEIQTVYLIEKQSCDRTQHADFSYTDEAMMQRAMDAVLMAGEPRSMEEAAEVLLWDADQLELARRMIADPNMELPEMQTLTESLLEEVPIWPLAENHRLTTLFQNPDAIYGKAHRGIDIAADTGTPVYAILSGTVVRAGWNDSYGYFVRIDHGNGRCTLYAHLSELNTSEGAWVAQGDAIGLVGSTGDSTGPHLHLEWAENGKLVNPLQCVKWVDRWQRKVFYFSINL